MSKDKTQEQPVSTSKFSIIRTLSRLLKLNDEGKGDNFITRLVKSLKRDVATLDKTMQMVDFKHKNAIEDLDSQIEDATEAVESAYIKIDMDSIQTNADCDSYMSTYLRNLEVAEEFLADLIKRKEEAKEAYSEKKKANKEAAAKLNTRISRLEQA